jgi:hypothetical protein
MIKDLKLEILTCLSHPSLDIELSYTKHPIY